jgi:hypothetical protein
VRFGGGSRFRGHAAGLGVGVRVVYTSPLYLAVMSIGFGYSANVVRKRFENYVSDIAMTDTAPQRDV